MRSPRPRPSQSRRLRRRRRRRKAARAFGNYATYFTSSRHPCLSSRTFSRDTSTSTRQTRHAHTLRSGVRAVVREAPSYDDPGSLGLRSSRPRGVFAEGTPPSRTESQRRRAPGSIPLSVWRGRLKSSRSRVRPAITTMRVTLSLSLKTPFTVVVPSSSSTLWLSGARQGTCEVWKSSKVSLRVT